ncbi:MAG: hypothetical protein IBX72_11950 [Nitrospirae bacterium]|nr:hypothetical protein [Nitrospirota bacterium]
MILIAGGAGYNGIRHISLRYFNAAGYEDIRIILEHAWKWHMRGLNEVNISLRGFHGTL